MIRHRTTIAALLALAAGLPARALQEEEGGPPADAPIEAPDESANEAVTLEPPPPPAEGVDAVLVLLDAGEFEAARAAALDLAQRDAALDPRDAARWSERDRALLDYVAALSSGALAGALFELEEPEWERIESLEDEGAEAFERALSATVGPDAGDLVQLRARAAYGAGTLLAHGAERTVRRAQTLALMQPQEVPFAADTPERELVDAAHDRFERARDALLLRLELDWRDADTRANLEWVQRRLKEIERLRERADKEQERREEEEQQEQDEQEQDESEEDSESEPSDDESGEDEPNEDEPNEEESSDDESGDDSSGDGDASQQEDEGMDDAESDDPDASEEELADEAPSEASDEQVGDGSDEGEAPPLETVEMSDVELRRLLQRLEDIDREGEETRRRLAASMRRRVERDW